MKEYLVQVKYEHEDGWKDQMRFTKKEVLDFFVENLKKRYPTYGIRILSRDVPEFELEAVVQ